MYQKYENAVEKVMEYLDNNNYASSIVYTHRRCFRLLKEFFEKKHAPYSHELALEWLDSARKGLCKPTFNNCRIAITRVEAAYQEEEITNTKAIYESQQNYQNLDLWCKHSLDAYLKEKSSSFSPTYLQSSKIAVARFLVYVSNQGVSKPEDISHRIVAGFYYQDKHSSYKSKDVYNNRIRMFLKYLVKKGVISSSIPLMLNKFTLSRIVFIEEVPKKEQELFYQVNHQILFPAEDFYTRSLMADSQVEQKNYSITARKIFHNAWKELYIFLEANELGYSKEIALAWATYMHRYTTQWKIFRRAMKLFEQFIETGMIQPEIVYSYQSDPADNLPNWCKRDYNLFVDYKKKEGLMHSTVSMYRSSCLRFLSFLIRAGITSWDMVTPEVIKQFHCIDPHKTPEGKNAYASKIRGFLSYMAETGQVASSLHLALSYESAPRISIITILDKHDLSKIYQYKEASQTAMQLRNIAMVLLGLRMGFRASDIVKMKLSDISWSKQTIAVQQQKTDKFLKLPIPIEVGNILYRYITTGRPETSSKEIFVAHRVPYAKLNRRACLTAMNNILDKQSRGFHIIRKTFASHMLQNNTEPKMIAETLGHSDDSTVMKYLSTHEEKMRMCALPLSELPVKGGMLL